VFKAGRPFLDCCSGPKPTRQPFASSRRDLPLSSIRRLDGSSRTNGAERSCRHRLRERPVLRLAEKRRSGRHPKPSHITDQADAILARPGDHLIDLVRRGAPCQTETDRSHSDSSAQRSLKGRRGSIRSEWHAEPADAGGTSSCPCMAGCHPPTNDALRVFGQTMCRMAVKHYTIAN